MELQVVVLLLVILLDQRHTDQPENKYDGNDAEINRHPILAMTRRHQKAEHGQRRAHQKDNHHSEFLFKSHRLTQGQFAHVL